MRSTSANILVVEDEGIVAMDIQRGLTALGYRVPVTACCADEAIRAANTESPDLVLMDISIDGDRDGIDTAKILRDRFGVPIIYLTAFADSATLDRAKRTEPYGYLSKPFRDTELRNAVEIALYRHSMEKERREAASQDLERLSALVSRDALTGLLNRRGLNEALAREVKRASRHEHPLSIAVFDLDHFKRINDTLGHAGGDHVLRTVSELLQASVRAEDYACRFGGEELVLILPGCSAENARSRVEAILKKIRSTPIMFDRREVKITSSAGIATYPADGSTPESLMESADAALYRAKRNGRDRLEVA